MSCNSILTRDRRTFVRHLECGLAHDRYPADQVHGLSKAGKPLLVRYDLAALQRGLSREELASRPPDLWKCREFLPVRRTEHIGSLGETHTPPVTRQLDCTQRIDYRALKYTARVEG